MVTTRRFLVLCSLSCILNLCGCSRQTTMHSSSPCGDVPLVTAAYENNISEVQGLLKQGMSANSGDSCGQTALIEATLHGYSVIVGLLLDKGADKEVKTSTMATPLIIAAYLGDVSSAKVLLDHGADVNAKDSDWTPLMAAMEDHVDLGQETMGYDPEDLSTEPKKMEKLLEIEKLLISHGANVNTKRNSKTALMIADQRHFHQVVTLLQKAGAKE